MKSTPKTSSYEWLIPYILTAHKYLEAKQFAEYFNVSYSSVLRMADLHFKREIEAGRDAEKIVFKKAALKDWTPRVTVNANAVIEFMDSSQLTAQWVTNSMGGRNALRRYL